MWVASNPLKTVAACLAAVAACSLGLLRFHQETNMVRLWLPRQSDFVLNNDWLWKNHPPDLRCAQLTRTDLTPRPEILLFTSTSISQNDFF